MSKENQMQLLSSSGCSRSKAEGAFIALAAGDALGWPQEFPRKALGMHDPRTPSAELRTWKRRSGEQYYPHEETIQRGEYSDDTQLTLAVARSRVVAVHSWWNAFTRTELPLWTLYERGGGGATKRAAVSWLRGSPPWAGDKREVARYFDAGGNGVTMRVLPHAVFYSAADDPAMLIRDVIMDGVATHGHPRALIGATAYAYAAWWLLRTERTIRFGELVEVLLENASTWGALPQKVSPRNGWLEAANQNSQGGYELLWPQIFEEMVQLLKQVQQGLAAGAISDDDEVLRGLGCFGKSKGAGTVSAAAAIYLCARHAPQPVQGVIKAAFAHGSDTDTLASMVGGLSGCLAGSDWLPTEWYSIQDCDYLRRLANIVAQGFVAAHGQPKQPSTIRNKETDNLIEKLVKGHKGDIDLDGVRSAQVTEIISPKPLSKTTVVQAWQLRTRDGQTIYITKVGRKPKLERGPIEHAETEFATSVLRQSELYSAVCGIKLSVDELDRMANFYEIIFGLRPKKRSSRFISFGTLSLVDVNYASELSANAVKSTQGPGRHRIEVHVDNLSAAYERAQQAGCVVQPITRMPWGLTVFHCRDPEGNILEVSEGK